MSDLLLRTPVQTWVSGSTLNIPLDNLPRIGPQGGRVIVKAIEIKSTFSVTTAAGSGSLVGDDQCGFIREAQVNDVEGVRFRGRGFHIRAHQQKDLMDRAFADPADYGAGVTGGSKSYFHSINFADPRATEPLETAMPMDDLLDGGFLSILCPTSAQMKGTGITLAAGTYEAVLRCYEEKGDARLHVRRERNFIAQDVATLAKIPVNSNLLVDAFLAIEAAAGGTAYTAADLVTMQGLNLSNVKLSIMQQAFLREHRWALAEDGWYAGKYLPLCWQQAQFAKQSEMPLIEGTLLAELTGTAGVSDVCYTISTPRTKRQIALAARANGLGASARVIVDTANGQNTDPTAWGPRGQFMPLRIVRG